MNIKIIGKDQVNCNRCWLDKEVLVLEVNGEKKNFCFDCYHQWRKENNVMPNSPIPAYNSLINAFDLLMNDNKVDVLLENLSEEERTLLYNHPILKHYDLLP